MSVQDYARGQKEHEDEEQSHAPAGSHSDGNGAEQVGQTSDEGVCCEQTDGRQHFLSFPLPPNIQSHGDPHRQAAQVAQNMKQPLVFLWVFAVLLLPHSSLPARTALSIGARSWTHSPVSDVREQPQQSAQSLCSNQRSDEQQHGTVHVAEKEQETQGNDITQCSQVSQPHLKYAKEAQETCEKTNKAKGQLLLD